MTITATVLTVFVVALLSLGVPIGCYILWVFIEDDREQRARREAAGIFPRQPDSGVSDQERTRIYRTIADNSARTVRPFIGRLGLWLASKAGYARPFVINNPDTVEHCQGFSGDYIDGYLTDDDVYVRDCWLREVPRC